MAKMLGILLTPPSIIILLALLGLLLQLRWRRIGTALVLLSVLALFVFSMPSTGHWLMRGLEAASPPLSMNDPSLRTRAGAIIVLGGGRQSNAPEYGDDDVVSTITLERLRYAAYLHRQTGLPILVSGGSPFGESISEAELMRRSLEQDFKIRAQWIEPRSHNTQENAFYSRTVLQAAGIRTAFLVTHAWHMPRAVWAFNNADIAVIPAPTGFLTRGNDAGLEILPAASALLSSSRALQERLGLWWYLLKYSKAAPTVPNRTTVPTH